MNEAMKRSEAKKAEAKVNLGKFVDDSGDSFLKLIHSKGLTKKDGEIIVDEIVEDIKFLHKETCLNMNNFNFMIGFKPQTQGEVELTALDEESQVALFNRMHKEFADTDLAEGLNNAWFAEFTPEYCTNCDNCGEKFFLLEKNGDIYSCVRGQGNKDFYYGNIYTDSVEEILTNARLKIFSIHNKNGFTEECGKC
jgi:uncharacterized protein